MGENLTMNTDLRQRPGYFWVAWQEEVHKEAARKGVEGEELTEVLRMLGAAQVRESMQLLRYRLDETFTVNQLVPAEIPRAPAKRRLGA